SGSGARGADRRAWRGRDGGFRSVPDRSRPRRPPRQAGGARGPFQGAGGPVGIAQENDFQSQMRIRGGDSSDTEVLLDGQPLPYPYHFGGSAGSAGALNGDLVESVEVQTGGFSVEYGDALAGVIDLSPRDRRPDPTPATAGL